VAKLSKIKPAVLTALMLLTTAGCNSVNLGQIDESVDDREEMAGPGIFADDEGETALKWSNEAQPKASQSQAVEAQPVESTAPAIDEKAEFEQFKQWNELRTNALQSPEYQEFLQWLEYRKFKAGSN
jgi:hypothetical protein